MLSCVEYAKSAARNRERRREGWRRERGERERTASPSGKATAGTRGDYLGKCRRRNRSRFSVRAGTCYQRVTPLYWPHGASRYKYHGGDYGDGDGGSSGGDGGEEATTHTSTNGGGSNSNTAATAAAAVAEQQQQQQQRSSSS